MHPGISERMYFLFCMQATSYHGLVEALLAGQKNKPNKKFGIMEKMQI